jgi:(R,R)-butanediol dehydrogenase / meso-butanediol dehydrogenase / diacetyl reductase
VAHHALDRTPRPPDEPILVIGGGPVGAAVALWARYRGAREVVVSDPIEHRRTLAERIGATATVDPNREDVASAFVALTGHRPGVVIECVGNPGLIQSATDVAAVDGHVTIVGVCMVDDAITPLVALQKELSLQYVLYYQRADFDASITALQFGALDPTPMLTGSTGFESFADRFSSLSNPTKDCKVLLIP